MVKMENKRNYECEIKHPVDNTTLKNIWVIFSLTLYHCVYEVLRASG